MPINLENFRKNLIYDIIAPVSVILQDLNEIAIIDRTAKAEQKRFTNLLTGFIIGALLLIFLIHALNYIGILLLLCFAIAAIYAGTMLSRHGRLNIQEQRYEILKKILEMLNRDLEDNATVNVRLVLSPPTQKNKRINTISHPYQSGFKIDLFRDEWLKLQGQFLDRTRFLLIATELYQTKYGWKQSSGKSKYKTKRKSKGLNISLSLNYHKRQYGATKILQDELMGAVKLPEKILVKQVRVTDKKLELIAKLPAAYQSELNIIYQTIAMMYLSLYQVLNLAHMLSKKREA